MTCDDLEVSLALAALGVADADELAWLDDATARDPIVARRRRELADAVAWLPLALPVARPPPFAA